MCRNACSVYLYLLCLTMWCLFCGCWCEVWPVAVLKAAPCMWRVQHEGQRQAVKLELDTHTNATACYLSWNCCRFPVFWGELDTRLTGISCIFRSQLLSWNHFIWTVEGSASAAFKYDLVCLRLYHSWLPKRLRSLSGDEMWKGRAVWNGSWCYVSAESVNHAAHVRGLLYSCHCTQQRMHCTHWLVSNAVRLTCGAQLTGTA